jgi:hypothetical protein
MPRPDARIKGWGGGEDCAAEREDKNSFEEKKGWLTEPFFTM